MSCFDEEPDGDPHGECAAEIARLNAELEGCIASLPGPIYMDPPDGGDVPVSEQLRRMAADAAAGRAYAMSREAEITDLLDDEVRGFLLPRIMYAVQQAQNGDPLKDFLDYDDEIAAYELLAKIGGALGLEPRRS